jgi:SAM-dependent methyltransferase
LRRTMWWGMGCGPGPGSPSAELLIEGRIEDVDPTSGMLEKARAQTEGHSASARISYAEGLVIAIRVAEGSATVVMGINSLHHWRDIEVGFAEIYRVRFDMDASCFVGEDIAVTSARVRMMLARAGFDTIKVRRKTQGEVSISRSRAVVPVSAILHSF